MRPLVRFILAMLVTVTVALLLGITYERELTSLEAENVMTILRLSGVEGWRMGNNIVAKVRGRWVPFTVTLECSGLLSLAVYLALVVGMPKMGLRARLFNALFGISLLYLANMLRIYGAIIGYYVAGTQGLNIVHYVLGPLALYTLILVLWASTLRGAMKSASAGLPRERSQ